MKYSFSLFKSVLLFIFVPYAAEGAGISDLRQCADPDCRNPVSTGVATLRYQSIDPLVLSFNQGDEITILSKEAGHNKELWGAEVRGKRGYIPKRLVKEMRIYVRNPTFTVPTEAMQQQLPPPMNPQAQQPPPQQQQMPPQQQQPPPVNHQQQPPPLMQQQGNFQPPQQQPWPAQPPPPQQQQQLPPPIPPPQPVEMKAAPQPVEIKATPQPVEMKATPLPVEMKATPVPEPIIKQEEAPITPPPEIQLEQPKPEVVPDDEEDDDDEDEDDEDDAITGATNKTDEDTMDQAPKIEPITETVELPQVPIVEQVLVMDPPPVEPLKDDEKIEEEPLKLHPPVEEEKEEVVMPNILLEEEEGEMKLNDTNEEKILELQPAEDFAIPDQKEQEEKSQSAEVEVVADAAEPLKELPTEEEEVKEIPSIIDSGSMSNTEEKIQSSVTEEGSNFNAESVTEVDGSGGGFITTALNWLGLNEKDESLIEASGDESVSKTLQEQIASMDPTSIPADTMPTEIPNLTSSPLEVPEGFCDKDDCGKITPPPSIVNEVPKEESILPPQEIPQVSPESNHDHHHHDHDHHGHGHSHNHDHGPPQEIPQVVLESNDNHDHYGHGHGHGHSHDHDHGAPQEVPQESKQDHHHHDHGHGHGHGHSHDHDGGFGHGHSHIPGYIPGFGHHYKPPVAQQPPPPPPVEQPVEQPTGQQVLEPLPEQPFYPPPLELEEPPKLPPPPMQIPPESEPQMNVPDYIPVEEIFRTAEEAERKRRLEEEQQQHQVDDNSEGVLSQVTSMLLGYAPIFQDLLQFNKFDGEGGSSSSGLYPTVMTGAIVLFLTLHYLVNNKSSERSLKARISQLDSLLYESQTAKEECGSIQTKLTEYETNAAELRSLKETAEIEKIALSRRIKELEAEKKALETDLESATESATEATRLFDELLASQTDSDSWQDSMLALQAQLNNQQQAVETLKASLSQKTDECDALTTEADELRIESERYKVRVKTLQSDFESLKTSNKNLQQKSAQEGTELVKLKQEKESWAGERRNLTNQANRSAKEAEEMRSKVEQLSKSLKAKEADLAKSIHLLKQSSSGAGNGDMMMDGQLSSLIQLEAELAEAKMTIERLNEEVKSKADEEEKFSAERMALQEQLDQWKTTVQTATKDKLEAETRLKVLSTYFTEKETQLHKELGTHEAKRAMTEENVTESVRKILETEENMALYKSQVETLTKEIEEQERSYKSRLAAQEKRAHENWVAARQLERRLEESKQEAAQLRARLTQAEKERKAEAGVKENGNVLANGVGPEVLGDLIKPVAKRVEDLALMDPSLLSPPIPPPPPLPMPPLGLDMGMMPFHDSMFPPPHFIPPPPDMHLLPPIPLPMDHHPHRPPPLGMIAPGGGAGPGYDVDFQRDRDPPRHRYRDGGRYGPQLSPGSERSDRSDRIMDRYDDRDYRPVSPYGRHGGGRPRSVGRSRDASPERPRSFSPLPSPLYPPQVHSPEDWDDGRGYNNNNNRPPMNPRNLRQPQLGPKTSSPLIHPVETNHRQH